MEDLEGLLDNHRADAFPESVRDGVRYGFLERETLIRLADELVAIAAQDGELTDEDLATLTDLGETFIRNQDVLPAPAQPYFFRLYRIYRVRLRLG